MLNILKAAVFPAGMAVVIYHFSKKGVEHWLVRDTSKDFHTHYGAIPSSRLKPGTAKVRGKIFHIVPAGFSDELRNIRRKAQIITPKDIGFVIAHAGLGPDSVVVESGAGSGGATLMFARICKRVVSYEIEEGNADIVRANLKDARLDNVQLVIGDFYQSGIVKRHRADLVLLDLPEPWRALESAEKSSRPGAYVVAYTPTIIQAAEFVANQPEGWMHERTLELIDRDWKVRGRAIRPGNAPMGHTGFLTIMRRLS